MDDVKKQNHLACEFSTAQQLYAQITFHGWWLSGFVAIALHDWIWAFVYLFIVAYGILGIIQRHLTCPRCPHLYEYGSCLQIHPKITLFVIKEKKDFPFTLIEKIIFISVFLLITVFPIYWLVNYKIALIGFIFFGCLWWIGQYFYFCKMCRVSSCPLNRVKNL